MNNPEVFRPKSNLVFAFSLYLLCIGLTVASVTEGNLHNALTAIFWSALVCTATTLLFIRPQVTFFDEGLIVTNPLQRFTIGWGDIESIEARYTMYLVVKSGNSSRRIYAWAAPAPGRYHARTIHPNEIKGMRIANPENMRPGESPRTHSGVATHLARLRFDAFQKGTFRNAEFIEHFDRTSVLIMASLFSGCVILWLL